MSALRLTGCVEPGDNRLRLLDEKNNKSNALVPGDVYLTRGQPVLLKGRTSKDDGDTATFTARKLVKDPGSSRRFAITVRDLGEFRLSAGAVADLSSFFDSSSRLKSHVLTVLGRLRSLNGGHRRLGFRVRQQVHARSGSNQFCLARPLKEGESRTPLPRLRPA